MNELFISSLAKTIIVRKELERLHNGCTWKSFIIVGLRMIGSIKSIHRGQ